jgi:hypothetical protein
MHRTVEHRRYQNLISFRGDRDPTPPMELDETAVADAKLAADPS